MYTNEQVAKKLNITVQKIYSLKAKYKHLLNEDHCALTVANDRRGNKFLLWSDLGLSKLKEFILLESEKRAKIKKICDTSSWIEKKDLAAFLAITESKLDQYFTEIKDRLWLGVDYTYRHGKNNVRQHWSKTGRDKLYEYMEYLHGYTYQTKKETTSFTQSDFDNAIADLESQITGLKAKYPEFVKVKSIEPVITDESNKFKGVAFQNDKRAKKYRANIEWHGKRILIGYYYTAEEAARARDIKVLELQGEGCTTNFAVEGIHTKVLFPDYPATKRHEATKSVPKPIEPVQKPIQLTMAANDDEIDENPNETFHDRMKAFALENGIELKTMKVA